MTKEELVAHIASEVNVTKGVANAVLDCLTETIIDRATRGQSTTLHRFGVFDCNHRAPRVGRNPQTGEPLTIDASTTLRFKPSKVVKERLN